MSKNGILAAGLGGYCLGSFALFVALRADGRVQPEHEGVLAPLAFLLLAVPVAVVLVRYLPRHPLTILLAIYVASVFTVTGLGNVVVAVAESGHLSDEVAVRTVNALWVGTLPLLPLLITVFPDGPPTGRWRFLLAAQLVAVATVLLVTVLDSPEDGLHPVAAVVSATCAVVLISTGAVAAVRLAIRAVRDRDVRRKIAPFAVIAGFLAFAYAVIAPLTLIFPDLRSTGDNELSYVVLIAGLPAAIGYAVVRHRLFGINLVLTRLIVAAAATLVLAVVYLGGVLGVAAGLGVPPGSLPAVLIPAALVAFVLVPAYRGLQGLVARAVYGSRGDPVTVVHTLGERLARTAPEDVPGLIVRVVRDSLKLSWVALDVEQDGTFARAAETGVAGAASAVERFDLSYAGAVPGRLLVQPRRGEQALGRLDRRLLRTIAEQAGPAVAAAQYVHELTLSRERLVLGREQERARLRRDLHDGLGPALAGISLALTAARRLLRSDPDQVDGLLGTAESEASRSSRDVRRILDDLRPPGLDELGLVGALEERGWTLSRPGEFAVTVIAEGLPPLPIAVETAAYRIAVEAMTNSARHARARRCTVELSADGALHLSVEDDGTGLPAQLSHGVGIQSMRARAVDLGGQLRLGPTADGGTRVAADLPLPAVAS
jgi:signal transduction histidine kinase